jgi:sulfoacetaldehyde acetyltransferase
MHGIEHAFGIIGSAFMPISDLFPQAGITFWDVAHETNGGLICDGYTRSTGKIAMAIAQNGPGITNFVTAVKTAYWNHTPMLLVTPQAANKTIGQGGFQEVEQMALFRDMVCYQEEVRDPSRTAEVLNRVITKAKRLSAPAQINIPRDYWTQMIDINLPAIVEFERPSGGEEAIEGDCRRTRCSTVAPLMAPSPMQPSKRPNPPAPSPSSCRARAGKRAQSALPATMKTPARIRTARISGAYRM